MFYIHGGEFTHGASNLFPAHMLAAFYDVVVVSINYRLGALGKSTIKIIMCMWMGKIKKLQCIAYIMISKLIIYIIFLRVFKYWR